MRKIICAILMTACTAAAVIAVPTKFNETHEDNWSSLSYVNIPILKILDSRDGYVVIYQKNRIGVGQTVIPKKWARGTKDAPRKLRVRNLTGGKLKPYMTVIKDGGAFKSVVLSVPASKSNMAWGVVANGKELEGLDKEELEEIEL